MTRRSRPHLLKRLGLKPTAERKRAVPLIQLCAPFALYHARRSGIDAPATHESFAALAALLIETLGMTQDEALRVVRAVRARVLALAEHGRTESRHQGAGFSPVAAPRPPAPTSHAPRPGSRMRSNL